MTTIPVLGRHLSVCLRLGALFVVASGVWLAGPSTALAAEQRPAVLPLSADPTLADDGMEEEQAMQPPQPVTGVRPMTPQPEAESTAPGLAVTYFYKKFYDLDGLDEEEDEGVAGKPIDKLDHATETGNVLTSEWPMLVGARIRGLIELDQRGMYVFRVNSNDGVRLTIGGHVVWLDPEVHTDRMSPPLRFVVEDPGWYELNMDYYQKKGTSALQLFWTPPGGDAESVVPASAFAHLRMN